MVTDSEVGTVIAFSPDGKIIVIDNEVWDAHTGEHIKTLKVDAYSSIAFSPNGKIIVIDNEVWDAHTGEHIKTLKRQAYSSSIIAISSDGKAIAGSSDSEIGLWDAHTGEYIKTLTTEPMDSQPIGTRAITFSPNGKIIAADSEGGTLKVWNVETGKHINTLTGHAHEITDIVFNSNGRTLATGSRDGTVLLWDVDLLQSKVISAEENTEFLNCESRIQQICEERGITTLVHFTRIGNLRNILHEGLLDHQSLLKRHGQQFAPNDRKRLDGHKEAICLSISFPNYQLFSKFSWSDNDSQSDYSGWVVLVFDAKVLWELDCAFCQENAASNAVRYISLEERKKPNALKGLFVDVCRDTKGNIYQRQSLQIPDDYPTHPQAEVLVFDRIQTDYIKEIHFYDASALKQWRNSNPWINPEELLHNQQYFQYGRDQIAEQYNLDDDIPF